MLGWSQGRCPLGCRQSCPLLATPLHPCFCLSRGRSRAGSPKSPTMRPRSLPVMRWHDKRDSTCTCLFQAVAMCDEDGHLCVNGRPAMGLDGPALALRPHRCRAQPVPTPPGTAGLITEPVVACRRRCTHHLQGCSMAELKDLHIEEARTTTPALP